jgi:SAM-dependent methyltransferase
VSAVTRGDQQWERFAQEDPAFYIWTTDRSSSEQAFGDSGRADAAALMDAVAPYLKGNGLVVEYGCGLGRLLLPMCEHFDRALGVDVAPSMLSGLTGRAEAAGLGDRVYTALATANWSAGVSADLIYSWHVFQHIASTATIRTALEQISRALKTPDGIGYLHFDVRRRTLAYWVRFAIPDPLLPRQWRRAIRRIRRTPEAVTAMIRAAGLEIITEDRRADHHVAYLVRPAQQPASG